MESEQYNLGPGAPKDGEALLRRVVPPLAAVVLLVAFTSLGFWQLDRAAQKEARRDLFRDASPHAPLSADMPFVEYKPALATGRFVHDRQVLIDNIVVDGRLGYYVVTAFEYASGQPLLLVNRGWIGRISGSGGAPDIDVSPTPVTIRGRMGRLPRVGLRPGPGFAGEQSWPKITVFPTIDEVAAELDVELLPFVLLLDPDPASGMLRDWQPRESGPMMHYGYAFQWFALALAVFVTAIWQLRKRHLRDRGS